MHVIATARNRSTITDLEALGCSTVSLEVTSTESIEAAKKEVEILTGGRLDILVNNASVYPSMFVLSSAGRKLMMVI